MESEEKRDEVESREASRGAMEEAVSDVNPQSEVHVICGETAGQQEGMQEELGETKGQDVEEEGGGQDSVEEGGVVDKEDQRDEEEARSSGSSSEESSDEGEGEGEAERGGTSVRSSQWSSREEKMKRLRELHKRRVRS